MFLLGFWKTDRVPLWLWLTQRTLRLPPPLLLILARVPVDATSLGNFSFQKHSSRTNNV